MIVAHCPYCTGVCVLKWYYFVEAHVFALFDSMNEFRIENIYKNTVIKEYVNIIYMFKRWTSEMIFAILHRNATINGTFTVITQFILCVTNSYILAMATA